MAKILSQDEVDALMGAVERGDLPSEDDGEKTGAKGERVFTYNFQRPNLVTRDQLRGLTTLHEDFARELQVNLAILLRTNVNMALVSTDQQLYSEFVFSLSEMTHAVLFAVHPLSGMAVLEVNPSLVFGFVDLLVGGKGDVETAARKLTDVEVAIIEPLIANIFTRLSQALRNIMPVEVKTDRHEACPEYIQAAPPDAPVVVLTFDAKIGLANGIINLCYPLPMVQAMLKELHTKRGQMDNYYGRSRAEETRRQLLTALLDVPVRTSVTLGRTSLRVEDWLTLAPGDVLVLDNPLSEPALLIAERTEVFQGIPGRSSRSLAFKVANWIESPTQNSLDGLLG